MILHPEQRAALEIIKYEKEGKSNKNINILQRIANNKAEH